MMDRDKPGNDIELLAALVERLRGDRHFMAYALYDYQQHMGLDDESLARELGTKAEMIVRLALCKRPDVKSSSFRQDVRELSDYTQAHEKVLTQVLTRCFSEDNGSLPAAAAVDLRPPVRGPRRPVSSYERLAAAFTRRALLFAGAIVLLLVVAGGLLWRQSTDGAQSDLVAFAPDIDPPRIHSSEAKDAAVASGAPESKSVHDPSRDRGDGRQNSAQRRQPAARPMIVNLERRSTLREAGEPAAQAAKIVRLPLSRTSLRLKLAAGSGPGYYLVTIVDAFAAPVFTTTTSSRGSILRAVVDTRRISPGEYRLCVRRESREPEVPDCFPVLIQKARTASDKTR